MGATTLRYALWMALATALSWYGRAPALWAEDGAESRAAPDRETGSQDAQPGQGKSPEKPVKRASPELLRLVGLLDHDDYFVRERATEQLSRADESAVPELVKAALGESLEASCRAVQVLCELSVADQPDAGDAALAALEELSNTSGTVVSKAAEDALRRHSAERSRRAVAELVRLGAVVTENDRATFVNRTRLLLGRNYTGGDQGLANLRWVTTLPVVSIRGAPITEQALPHLKRLQAIERLEIYGTKISSSAAMALREELPKVEVEWRAGGFLGISGVPGQNGCLINTVQPDSAAEAAGLQQGDVVVRFDDVAVTGFEDLTAEISKRAGGDKVTLLIRRDNQEREIEATLGHWE